MGPQATMTPASRLNALALWHGLARFTFSELFESPLPVQLVEFRGFRLSPLEFFPIVRPERVIQELDKGADRILHVLRRGHDDGAAIALPPRLDCRVLWQVVPQQRREYLALPFDQRVLLTDGLHVVCGASAQPMAASVVNARANEANASVRFVFMRDTLLQKILGQSTAQIIKQRGRGPSRKSDPDLASHEGRRQIGREMAYCRGMTVPSAALP